MERRRFATVCADIGDDLAGTDGFVSVRSLLERFRAQLILRPLLVEGMLATVPSPAGGASWTVLVDCERYPVTDRDVLEESSERPLPQRMRNTVAHELAHSLAFRPTEFGIDLQSGDRSDEDRAALVREIERDTEILSPLLLWSEQALVRLVTKSREVLTVDQLQRECRKLGVSRHLMINRLHLLGLGGDKGASYYSSLGDMGIGTGEWTKDGKAVLRNWPLFLNFHRNIIPELFLKVRHQDRLPATAIFDDSSFVLCGGARRDIEFEAFAGTGAAQRSEKMTVRCEVEGTRQKPGSSFLYAMRKVRQA